MKKLYLIAMVVLAGTLWACRKGEPENPFADAPWAIDETLPVPIQFKLEDPFYIDTKSQVLNAPITTLEDLDLEILALDLNQYEDLDNPLWTDVETVNAAKTAELEASPYVALYNAKAKGSGNAVQFVDGNGADMKRYYPLSSGTKYCYDFYGYYLPKPLTYRIEDKQLYATFTLSPVSTNNADILWAHAEAEDFNYPGETVNHGFNASYIRNARLAGVLDQKKPHLAFDHKASAVHVIVKAANATAAASFEGGKLTVGSLKVATMIPYAKMNLITGEISVNNWRETTTSGAFYGYTSTPVVPTVDGVELGSGFFIIPGERTAAQAIQIKFTLTPETGDPYTTPTPVTLALPTDNTYEAGKSYTYYIYVKSLEEFQITTSLTGWVDGTFDDPSNGADDPGDNGTVLE